MARASSSTVIVLRKMEELGASVCKPFTWLLEEAYS